MIKLLRILSLLGISGYGVSKVVSLLNEKIDLLKSKLEITGHVGDFSTVVHLHKEIELLTNISYIFPCVVGVVVLLLIIRSLFKK